MFTRCPLTLNCIFIFFLLFITLLVQLLFLIIIILEAFAVFNVVIYYYYCYYYLTYRSFLVSQLSLYPNIPLPAPLLGRHSSLSTFLLLFILLSCLIPYAYLYLIIERLTQLSYISFCFHCTKSILVFLHFSPSKVCH